MSKSMNPDFIYFRLCNSYCTIYGKVDMTAPQTMNDPDGTFIVYPTCAVTLQEDRVYYEEGADIDGVFNEYTLKCLNDENDDRVILIDEQKFEAVKKVAQDWILKHNELMAQYQTIKAEWA